MLKFRDISSNPDEGEKILEKGKRKRTKKKIIIDKPTNFRVSNQNSKSEDHGQDSFGWTKMRFPLEINV